jgi:hypothetical protein
LAILDVEFCPRSPLIRLSFFGRYGHACYLGSKPGSGANGGPFGRNDPSSIFAAASDVSFAGSMMDWRRSLARLYAPRDWCVA